ncbi:SGNH/GDSL hydrolase family protein [Candidatus Fermentibacteria bacterium]|nr:SGNH/GDSL hydrolase family protein [Candidatus Fermentibacteria bacterium]
MSKSRLQRIRSLTKRLAFSVVPLIVLAGISETLLRIDEPSWMACVRTRACPPHDLRPAFYTQQRGNFVVETAEPLSLYHPTRFWWPRPHVQGTVCGTPGVRTNSFGHRGPEIELSPTRRNVLLVGDSVVWGSAVQETERFSDRTGSLLRARPGLGDVQMVNAAVVGFSTFQALQYVKEEGARFRPEVVIVCAGINDCWLFNRSDRESYRANMTVPQRVKRFLMRSNAFVLIDRYVRELATWIRTGENPAGLTFMFREPWNPRRQHRNSPEETELNIEELGAWAAKAGAGVVLILEDYRTEHPENWDPVAFVEGRQRLQSRAAARGWRVIRIDNMRRAPYRLQPADYFVDFCHLNPRGHEIVGAWLADVLEELLRESAA